MGGCESGVPGGEMGRTKSRNEMGVGKGPVLALFGYIELPFEDFVLIESFFRGPDEPADFLCCHLFLAFLARGSPLLTQRLTPNGHGSRSKSCPQ